MADFSKHYFVITFGRETFGEAIATSFVIGAQLSIRLAAQVCNRPDADAPQVAYLINLQVLVAHLHFNTVIILKGWNDSWRGNEEI